MTKIISVRQGVWQPSPEGRQLPPPPPKKGMKATIHKVFILDAQGGYAGEYAPNENCVVEFSEFLAADVAGWLKVVTRIGVKLD